MSNETEWKNPSEWEKQKYLSKLFCEKAITFKFISPELLFPQNLDATKMVHKHLFKV